MSGKGCSRRERALIREKYQEGKTVCKLCEEYQLHKATVYWILAETLQVPRKHRCPTKLSQHKQCKTLKSTTKSATKLANLAGISISTTTCHCELAQNAFHHEHLPIVNGITPSTNRKKFLQQSIMTWGAISGNRILVIV